MYLFFNIYIYIYFSILLNVFSSLERTLTIFDNLKEILFKLKIWDDLINWMVV
jgi:hypothetical protein